MRTGIAVVVRGSEPVVRPAPQVEIALFRIAQEALNNVAKHARAHRVEIELDYSNGECVMYVQDDGIGFDGAAIASDKPKPGLGMVTIEPEPDGIVRRVPLVLAVGPALFPALSFEMLRVVTGQSVAVRSGAYGLQQMLVGDFSMTIAGAMCEIYLTRA